MLDFDSGGKKDYCHHFVSTLIMIWNKYGTILDIQFQIILCFIHRSGLHILLWSQSISEQPTVDLLSRLTKTEEEIQYLWTWIGWMSKEAKQARHPRVYCLNQIYHLIPLDMTQLRSTLALKVMAEKKNISFLSTLKWRYTTTRYGLYHWLKNYYVFQ